MRHSARLGPSISKIGNLVLAGRREQRKLIRDVRHAWTSSEG